MRILCIDFGEKRLGIAISDPLGITAQGIGVLKKQASFKKDLEEIQKIIDRYDEVSQIIVGLPKTLKGEIGIKAKQTLEFVDFLKENIKIPVETWDERMTTVSAQKSLQSAGLNSRKQRKVIDQVAAGLILQNYLDYKKK